MRILIDADVLAYRAAYATEKTKYLVEFTAAGQGVAYFDNANDAKASEGVIWSRKEVKPVEDATQAADSIILDICNQLEAKRSDVVMILSGVGNFRHKIATRAEYKGNRVGAERPKNYNAVREHLITEWKAIVTAGEEADDRLGIEMTRDANSVCCSIDKDLKQLPGWHYNFHTSELVAISGRQADLNFFGQVLSGDAVDNVPGLKGIGVVKAEKALAPCASPLECWNVCWEMYVEQFGSKKGPKYAIEAARLLHVRRKPKQIWSPMLVDPQPWEFDEVMTPCPRKVLQFSPIPEEVPNLAALSGARTAK